MARDAAELRRRMVERQIAARGVRDPAVLGAMRAVPRHEFAAGHSLEAAYDDTPLPVGEGQTISQPYIVAVMTEAMEPGPGDRVLELGCGTGYQAAVLAEIVDRVHTIEYFPSLAETARARLERLGYRNVEVRIGSGWGGWPEAAPFDAAIVTFAAPEVPRAVVEQLRIGGRLVLPLGDARDLQELMAYRKREDGTLDARALGAVRFVPLQGERD